MNFVIVYTIELILFHYIPFITSYSFHYLHMRVNVDNTTKKSI